MLHAKFQDHPSFFRNQGFKSIEEELCTALLNVGVIPQGHYDSMQKVGHDNNLEGGPRG